MAESNYPERTNWYQCVRLLMGGGRLILKEILKQCYEPGTLDEFLNLKPVKDILDDLLQTRKLNKTQWDQLFPHADIEKLDISLLSFIILNCVIQPNSPQRKAVEDIRNLRNSVFGHTSTESMTKDEFERNWNEIIKTFSKAQQGFGLNIFLNEVIDKIQKEQVVDVELLKELEAWKQFDAGLKQELLYVRARVSNLEEKFEDIQKHEQRRTIDDKGWSELQNLLVNRYKILIKSPVTAAPPLSHETEIDDIYEEPQLKLVNHKALRKLSPDNNEKSLSLKDIFLNDGHKCYNIYVTGDAGIGKTSLCKFIVSAWCKTRQDKINNDFNDFELALMQFDFLFYISLRHATGQFDIEKMIESQLLKHCVPNNKVLSGLESQFVLQKLFKLFAEQCLIILDGLDEWTARRNSTDPSISNGVPMRNPSLQYTIMTFTRPWKLEELRLKDCECDRQIKITGVKDISAFGRKLISYFNKQENTNMTYTDFDRCLKAADLDEMQETPFLVKHLICLWFNNKEFGKSKTHIYTSLLELWFQRAEKRENERHLKHRKNTTITIPKVFKKYGKCDSYKTLLMAVGKLAFETLMHRKGMQLVFDSSEKQGVSKDQMSICLKVGILTQSILPDMISEKKVISFSHKTFHEYFAALYMGWHGSNPENIESRVKDITLSDMEEFFIFLSGMWPSVFERLIEIHLEKMWDKYLTFNRAQDLVIKCCKESLKQNNICPKVNLRGIVIGNIFKDQNISLLSCMHQHNFMPNSDFGIFDLSNLTKLKGISIDQNNGLELHLSPAIEKFHLNFTALFYHKSIESLMESVSSMKGLGSIRMGTIYCIEHGRYNCFLNVDLSKLDVLTDVNLSDISVMEMCLSPATKRLNLDDIKLFSHNGLVSLMESVANMKGLESIDMETIYCREHGTNKCFLNVDLSKLDVLTDVDLSDISVMEMCLSPATKRLNLDDIKLLKHNVEVSLMESVANMKGLESIDMGTIYCREHGNNKCFLNVDLSKLDVLTHARLSDIPVMEMCLSPATKKLYLNNVKLLKHNGLVSLMESVANMKGLKSINIYIIYCREHGTNYCFLNVDLSKLDVLTNVNLSDISVMEMCLRPATKELKLDDIIWFNHNGLVSLMESVANMKGLESIRIGTIYCREHGKNKCFLNVDLSKLDVLTYVELSDIPVMEMCLSPATKELNLDGIKWFSHNGLVSLMESVANMKGLESIDMENIYCREHGTNYCFLNVDLSKLDVLTYVRLSDIPVMEMCLSPATKELNLNDIKWFSHNGLVSLMESVANMKELESIDMENIYCREHGTNKCFLNVDLSKLDVLTDVNLSEIPVMEMCLSPATKELNLRNITLFKHNVVVSLMESLANMKGFESINMNAIYCREHGTNDCFLNVDLSKLDVLTYVRLSDIPVMEMYLSPATTRLNLDDIKLLKHNVVVSLMESLANMKGLESINMVTIYCREHGRNKCFLNVDLSKLDVLTYVRLSDISVMEMCLSPATKELNLNNIKWFSHNGLMSLMESVANIKGLESIRMETIYCREHGTNKCFLNVDLSKLDVLTDVDLSDISVMEMCLSPATKELNLNNITLLKHNVVVSLTESVTSKKGLESIRMETIYCREHGRNKCFLNVDLLKLDVLEDVKLSDISVMEMCLSPATKKLNLNDIKWFSHNGLVSLMESVANMKGLQSIDMGTIYCRELGTNDSFLNVDLSKLDVLTYVRLSDISVMEMCLSPATKELNLNNIKLLKHNVVVSLMESVANMKGLESIRMETIYGREHDTNECILNVDLSKLHNLTNVELSDISVMEMCLSPATKELNLDDIKWFSHNGLVSLMESVANMKGLESINMETIYCREHGTNDCFQTVGLSKLDVLTD